jgi:integrase
MPTAKLTARSVAAITTDQVQEEFYDELLKGLVLRVGKGGTKTWVVRYRANGKHRRLTLGRYPSVTLADARDRAREAMSDAQSGEDPAADRQVMRSTDTTFSALADEVLEALSSKTRATTHRERRRIVDTELRPHWKHRPASSITRRDVVQLVERIEKRGAPVMANRTLAVIKLIFNTGLDREFATLEANPAARVKPTSAEAPRDRYLTGDEIKQVWSALADETALTRALFRFTLLTAQRVGSVCAMRWSDIDAADVWHIPASAFKGKRPHLVPLSAEAMFVLAEVRKLTGGEGYVFPGRTEGEHRASINKALQGVRDRVDIAAWTAHDFRTTFRTHATRPVEADHPNDPTGLGLIGAVADAVLGHKERTIGFAVYTAEPERYLLAEKRDALRRWGAFVATTVA